MAKNRFATGGLNQKDEAISPDNQFYRYWLLANYSAKDNAAKEEMAYLEKAHRAWVSLLRISLRSRAAPTDT